MRSRSFPPNKATVDLALLILRLVLGVTFCLHGAQRLFGVFGGSGLAGFTHVVAAMGVPHAHEIAVAGAGAELVGGAFVLLGILTEIGALAIAVAMGYAIWKVTGRHGFFLMEGGCEYNVLVIAACVALILAGPGRFAIWRLGRR